MQNVSERDLILLTALGMIKDSIKVITKSQALLLGIDRGDLSDLLNPISDSIENFLLSRVEELSVIEENLKDRISSFKSKNPDFDFESLNNKL
jgi:hypothetical protein